jgi:hypothetical protein
VAAARLRPLAFARQPRGPALSRLPIRQLLTPTAFPDSSAARSTSLLCKNVRCKCEPKRRAPLRCFVFRARVFPTRELLTRLRCNRAVPTPKKRSLG